MLSQKQLEANKENAKLGGVKTPEGKEMVKFNAIKHGVFRQTITEYEDGFYTDVFEDLINELKPAGIIEEILVERIATCYIKLFRLAKAEQEHIKATINPQKDIIELDMKVGGYLPKVNIKAIESLLNVYGRYETTIENRLYKSLHELERIQRTRKGETVAPPLAVDISQMGSFSES